MYVCMYVYVCIYIYIYIYKSIRILVNYVIQVICERPIIRHRRQQSAGDAGRGNSGATPTFPTKIIPTKIA